MKIAVGEVWAWFDPDFMLLADETHPYLFLVLQRGGYPNPATTVMLDLLTGEIDTNFPDYAPQNWTRIA